MNNNLTAQKGITLKKIIFAGIMAALSFAMILLIRFPIIPSAPHLIIDGGNIAILITGFLLGPWWGLAVTGVVALLQGLLLSADWMTGVLMHVISSGTFVVVSGLIYRRFQSFKGALIGLVAGGLAMVLIMIPANLLIMPWYYKMEVEAVTAILPTAIIPFNLIKAGLNAAVTALLYHPLKAAFRLIERT